MASEGWGQIWDLGRNVIAEEIPMADGSSDYIDGGGGYETVDNPDTAYAGMSQDPTPDTTSDSNYVVPGETVTVETTPVQVETIAVADTTGGADIPEVALTVPPTSDNTWNDPSKENPDASQAGTEGFGSDIKKALGAVLKTIFGNSANSSMGAGSTGAPPPRSSSSPSSPTGQPQQPQSIQRTPTILPPNTKTITNKSTGNAASNFLNSLTAQQQMLLLVVVILLGVMLMMEHERGTI